MRLNIYCYLNNGYNDNSRKEVENVEAYILENYPQMRYIDALNIIEKLPTMEIRDREVIENCKRYFYCKEWNTAPYPNYDDTPKEWKDFDNEMRHCLNVKQDQARVKDNGNREISKANRNKRKRG